VRIKLIKPITVRSIDGVIVQELAAGDICEATFDAGHYWVSCPPIYKDEGIVVEEPIDERFIQLSNN
jgi:hypothetical protein